VPIQFRCSHCNKSIKAPDNLGGKQAKCPKCGARVEVPAIISEAIGFPDDFDAFLQKQSSDAPQPPPPPLPPKARSSNAHSGLPNIPVTSAPRDNRTQGVKITRSQVLTRTLGLVAAGLYALFFLGAIAAQIFGDKTSETPGFVEVLPGLLFAPLLIVGGLVFYCAPTMVAYVREHQNTVPIMILNLVFGWTLLGWVGSLAWACSSDVKESRQYVRQVIVHESDESHGSS